MLTQNTHAEAMKSTDDKDQLKKEQFLWMKERNQCKENTCIKKTCKSRIEELKIFVTDIPMSESDANIVKANIVSSYFKTLCYPRSNTATYQVRYISAEEKIPEAKRCTVDNGKTVHIIYSEVPFSEQGECGATPEVDYSLWIGSERVLSKELLTQRCNYESAIKSIKIQNNTITTCIYATRGEGISLKIDKNKVSCSTKTIPHLALKSKNSK